MQNVSETGSLSIFRWVDGDTNSVAFLIKIKPQSLDDPCHVIWSYTAIQLRPWEVEGR
jgi:hypothetical protein